MFLDAKHGESSNHTVEISFEEDVDEITKKLGPEYKFKDIVYQYGLEELDPEDQIGDVFEEGMMLTGVITNDGIEMGRKDIQNKSKAVIVFIDATSKNPIMLQSNKTDAINFKDNSFFRQQVTVFRFLRFHKK